MNALEFKKEEIKLRTHYAVVRQPGVYQPDSKGRTILNRNDMVEVFTLQSDPRRLLGLAQWITGTHLENTLADKKYTADDRSHIVNQHFDFAQIVLLHHKNKFGELYQSKIDIFERNRGEFLRQVATLEDATETNALEYGYWLSGYSNKFETSDPAKSKQFKNDARAVFLQLHQAGNTDATEALALSLYEDEQIDPAEAITLWEKAASVGNVAAIQNLSAVIMADDTLLHEERNHSLMAIWEGIAANKQNTREIAQTLKKAGLTMPVCEAAPL